MNNYAYVDGQNLHSGVSAQRWKLDHKKFREYLRQEHSVEKAYIFIGFMEEYQDLYNALQEAGFILHFKPLVRYDDGQIKGNVDADMVLKVMIDFEDYDKAVIVSGDGDFAGLIRHLSSNKKLETVIIPNKDTYSSLFKRIDDFDRGNSVFISQIRDKVEYNPRRRHNTTDQQDKNKPTKPTKPAKQPQSRKSTAKPKQSKSSPSNSRKPKASQAPRRKTLAPKKKVEANLLAAIENQSD